MSNATFTAEQVSEEFQVLKMFRDGVSNIVAASATKSVEHCRRMAKAQIERLANRRRAFQKMLDAAQGLDRLAIEAYAETADEFVSSAEKKMFEIV